MSIYETLDEANRRIGGTVIYQGDKPVWVHECRYDGNDKMVAAISDLPNYQTTAREVAIEDPSMNWSRYNIGYINLDTGAIWANRLPTRGKYKQGLYRDNMRFTRLSPMHANPEFSTVMRTIGFRDMLEGTYPSLSAAISRLRADYEPPLSVAFQKDFAIRRDPFRGDFYLDYKGEPIGFGTEEFQIPDNFKYLREIINKHGIKVK